ncbi:hypothetical protein MRX96_044550 [Rhipicephalus microplus]
MESADFDDSAAGVRTLRNRDHIVGGNKPQNTAYGAYPLCNQYHGQHHPHLYVSPAELQRGNRSALHGFCSPTAVPVVPPYSQASPAGLSVVAGSDEVQQATDAQRTGSGYARRDTTATANDHPSWQRELEGCRSHLCSPGATRLPEAAPQVAQCRQQSEFDKGPPAGAEGRINWPFVLLTVMVTMVLVAVGLVTSSTGFKSFLVSDYTSAPKFTPWALPEFEPWTARVNAVQPWYVPCSSFQYPAYYRYMSLIAFIV